MSGDVSLWAMRDAPVANVEEWAVLVALSEQADDDGCNAHLSQATIAERTRLSSRTVGRRLTDMEGRGVIARGDQAHPALLALPADKRPVNWDLMVPFSWFPNIDRIQRDRGRRGRPALTPDDRPELGPAPDKSRRQDAGIPRLKATGDAERDDYKSGRTTSPAGQGGRPDFKSPGQNGTEPPSGVTTSPTTYVPPSASISSSDVLPFVAVVADATPPKAKPSGQGTRLPAGWEPPERAWAWAAHEFPGLDARAEHARFVDHWIAAPGAKGRKADWPATWRNWMRTAWDNHRAREARAARYSPDRSVTDDRAAGWYAITPPRPTMPEQLAIGGNS